MESNNLFYEVSEEELINSNVTFIVDFLNDIEMNKKLSYACFDIRFSKVNSALDETVNIDEKKMIL